ncbi:efflux RND transporter periplasmic adaptor subunit [Kordiimonas sp. SCSIO 12610]|uniref:efflux RND transporter periplasmic adaptor subunit n=1 Tax=Kordiimonas sp. SCSIO 12610 TaxID=2829597 RepID=UPI002109A1D9|nr:HlyD family efflux transporter periplasmic adaptor subunit [Kordiimonas sp. SCSIO 12610]UTW55704.1 HlyD family efflux transporter periplasmic adaptor subunit [Kordiimonas sp. SCSIO 12610]
MPFRDMHIQYFTTLHSLKPPRIMRTIAWFLSLSLVATIVFMIFVPWVQTTSGPGNVTALSPNDRLQEINALVSGRIQKWFVRDGSYVKENDPIVQLIDNDPNFLDRLRAERAQVLAKLSAAETAMETAELDLTRTKNLFDQGLASRREFEQSRIRVEGLRGSVAEASAELNRVDVSLSRSSIQTVRAPRDGVILRVNAGDTSTLVNAGDVVATFIPDGAERAVELFIDGRDIALARVGDKVRLQFEGWPVVQFSGWPSVAIGTFGGEVVAIDPSAQSNGLFRILVSEDKSDPHPWPDSAYVRFGSKARGWVTFETVPVGYEVWRQLNNFPPEFRRNLEGSSVLATGEAK